MLFFFFYWFGCVLLLNVVFVATRRVMDGSELRNCIGSRHCIRERHEKNGRAVLRHGELCAFRIHSRGKASRKLGTRQQYRASTVRPKIMSEDARCVDRRVGIVSHAANNSPRQIFVIEPHQRIRRDAGKTVRRRSFLRDEVAPAGSTNHPSGSR